jgi:uncharacterized membrane protein
VDAAQRGGHNEGVGSRYKIAAQETVPGQAARMFGIPFEAVARVLFWLAVIVFLLAGLVYLMRHLRDHEENEGTGTGDLMTSFRDIHARGQLSDEEYRAIKSRLSTRMQGELKRDDDRS